MYYIFWWFIFRSSELKSLAGRKYLDALCVYFWATTPVLISILTFSTYVALGHKLTAAKVSTLNSIKIFTIEYYSACINVALLDIVLDCSVSEGREGLDGSKKCS